MLGMKISLLQGDLLSTRCSMAFMKHIVDPNRSLSAPEQAVDNTMNGKITSLYKEREQEPYISVDTARIFPFRSLHIINFHQDDLPFRYSSLDTYARRIIELAQLDQYATSIATPIHGPGSGLDASEAMETMLIAFSRILGSKDNFGNLHEIVFVEKNPEIFQRLQNRMEYLLSRKQVVNRKEDYIFLNPTASETLFDSDKSKSDQANSRYLFVAMPFAKEFNNVYYLGIKGLTDQLHYKCERVDQEQFTGDIVRRIKERIGSAQLVIADLIPLPI